MPPWPSFFLSRYWPSWRTCSRAVSTSRRNASVLAVPKIDSPVPADRRTAARVKRLPACRPVGGWFRAAIRLMASATVHMAAATPTPRARVFGTSTPWKTISKSQLTWTMAAAASTAVCSGCVGPLPCGTAVSTWNCQYAKNMAITPNTDTSSTRRASSLRSRRRYRNAAVRPSPARVTAERTSPVQPTVSRPKSGMKLVAAQATKKANGPLAIRQQSISRRRNWSRSPGLRVVALAGRSSTKRTAGGAETEADSS